MMRDRSHADNIGIQKMLSINDNTLFYCGTIRISGIARLSHDLLASLAYRDLREHIHKHGHSRTQDRVCP